MPFNDDDLNQLIAPYQSAAQRMVQPYPMLGGTGGTFAANHPMMARMLNSGLMAAAMTPGPQGPEGIGGGISRSLQGVLGANQYKRQQQMMAAMLPYQMLQPRLQAEKEMAETYEARQRGQYYGDITDIKGRMADIAQQRVDQNKYGHLYNDPTFRLALDNITSKSYDTLTPEEHKAVSDEYVRLKSGTERQPQGSYEERIATLLSPKSTPEEYAEGVRRQQLHLDTVAAAAGGAEAARKHAEDPYVLESGMIARTKNTLYDKLPKDPEKDPEHMTGKLLSGLPETQGEESVQKYQKAKADYQTAKVKQDTDYLHYSASTAPKQGVTLEEYQAHPEQYPPKNASRADRPSGDNRPASTPSPTSSTPTPNPHSGMVENIDSGAKWVSSKPNEVKTPGDEEFLKTLRQSSIPDSLRQDIWDTFRSTNDPVQFRKNIDKLPISKQNKDDITNMKFKGTYKVPVWNPKTGRYE